MQLVKKIWQFGEVFFKKKNRKKEKGYDIIIYSVDIKCLSQINFQ